MAAAAGQTKSKAAKQAKGARAKAKASAGSGRKALTIPQRAMQKLRENFRHLSEHCQMVKVHAPTGRSLYQQLQHDISLKDGGDAGIVFGGLYYEDMGHRYSDEGSLFGLLRPDAADDSAPNGQLLQVAFVLF